MNRTKARICAALLAIIIFASLFSLLLIDEIGANLYSCVTGMITGSFIVDKIEAFYKWLIENK